MFVCSPMGKKLRSRKEVQAYCDEQNISVDIEMFKFARVSLASQTAAAKKANKSVSNTPKTPATVQKTKSPKTTKTNQKKPNLTGTLVKI